MISSKANTDIQGDTGVNVSTGQKYKIDATGIIDIRSASDVDISTQSKFNIDASSDIFFKTNSIIKNNIAAIVVGVSPNVLAASPVAASNASPSIDYGLPSKAIHPDVPRAQQVADQTSDLISTEGEVPKLYNRDQLYAIYGDNETGSSDTSLESAVPAKVKEAAQKKGITLEEATSNDQTDFGSLQ